MLSSGPPGVPCANDESMLNTTKEIRIETIDIAGVPFANDETEIKTEPIDILEDDNQVIATAATLAKVADPSLDGGELNDNRNIIAIKNRKSPETSKLVPQLQSKISKLQQKAKELHQDNCRSAVQIKKLKSFITEMIKKKIMTMEEIK